MKLTQSMSVHSKKFTC